MKYSTQLFTRTVHLKHQVHLWKHMFTFYGNSSTVEKCLQWLQCQVGVTRKKALSERLIPSHFRCHLKICRIRTSENLKMGCLVLSIIQDSVQVLFLFKTQNVHSKKKNLFIISIANYINVIILIAEHLPVAEVILPFCSWCLPMRKFPSQERACMSTFFIDKNISGIIVIFFLNPESMR